MNEKRRKVSKITNMKRHNVIILFELAGSSQASRIRATSCPFHEDRSLELLPCFSQQGCVYLFKGQKKLLKSEE